MEYQKIKSFVRLCFKFRIKNSVEINGNACGMCNV